MNAYREHSKRVRRVPMPLPPVQKRVESKRKNQIQSRFERSGPKVTKSGLVPGTNVLGVIGVRQPFPLVGEPSQIVRQNNDSERHS